MLHTTGTEVDPTNNPIIIQDIVVAAPRTTFAGGPTGEFDGKKPKREEASKMIDRLFGHIQRLVTDAANIHRQSNFEAGQLMQGKENNITRLVVNEFFFYTQKPLEMDQFETLMQKVRDMASKQPENLHLILSSFAVKTTDDEVMSVVAQLECGQNPKINLIVKNNISLIDPVYKSIDKAGDPIDLPNVDKHSAVSDFKITVSGQSFPFSFNNVHECMTAGGARYHSCIDICLDHEYGVAKTNLEKKLEDYRTQSESAASIPLQFSHVVVSNSIELYPECCIGSRVTHADPKYSFDARKQADVVSQHSIKTPMFGTPAEMIVTQSTPCDVLKIDLPEMALSATEIDELTRFLSGKDDDSTKDSQISASEMNEFLAWAAEKTPETEEINPELEKEQTSKSEEISSYARIFQKIPATDKELLDKMNDEDAKKYDEQIIAPSSSSTKSEASKDLIEQKSEEKEDDEKTFRPGRR